MQVEEAVNRAKDYIRQIFAKEDASEIRLEEVEFDEPDASWIVTISLVRPRPARGFEEIIGRPPNQRAYKTVKIADHGRGIPSVKIRQMHGED